jgi:hypothetical protein
MRYKGERPLVIRMVISLFSEIFNCLRTSVPLYRLVKFRRRAKFPWEREDFFLYSMIDGFQEPWESTNGNP